MAEERVSDNFIRTLFCALLLPLALGACAHAAAPLEERAYGVQLYTVRADMERDFAGSLERVAKLGYREVEFAGLYGHSPQEARAITDRLGLRIAGSHGDWRRFRDDPAGLIAETKALGSPWLVLAWLPPEERGSIEQWNWWADHLNGVARTARAHGIRTAYHAHDFEYEPIDGVRPIDVLMARLDPANVDIELDVYWTQLAGADPTALLKSLNGRIPLLHIKDMAKGSSEMVDVGDGRIDFAALIPLASQGGSRHFLVEHDISADPWLTLERSLTYLENNVP